MLAGQFGREGAARGVGEIGAGRGGGQEQLRRMMDLPCLTETDWATTDRVSCCSFFCTKKQNLLTLDFQWTALMEAASFGQAGCVSLLVAEPTCELDAVNIRGQTAAEVAAGRGHSKIAETLRAAAEEKENPEEVRKIRNLEEEAEKLKVNKYFKEDSKYCAILCWCVETKTALLQTFQILSAISFLQVEARRKLLSTLDGRHAALSVCKARHEAEMEPLTAEMEQLQAALDTAMKQRLRMITRQVESWTRIYHNCILLILAAGK